MPHSASDATATVPPVAAAPLLTWRVHLLRRDRSKLPVLILTFFIGIGCVWLMFGSPLPVLAAALLMAGSVSDYLFPMTFRLTETGVFAEGGTSKLALKWKEVKRVVPLRGGILLSPLPVPSRLDAFRGIFLRFAPDGEPGDRASITEILTAHLSETIANPQNRQDEQDFSG